MSFDNPIVTDPDERDAKIAELEQKLGEERSYSQMVELYLQKALEDKLPDLMGDRFTALESTGWSTQQDLFNIKSRIDINLVSGSDGYHIDKELIDLKRITNKLRSLLPSDDEDFMYPRDQFGNVIVPRDHMGRKLYEVDEVGNAIY